MRGVQSTISPAPLVKAPLVVTLEDRFLTIEFAELQACLSWAIVGGGKTVARRVVWHQVHNRELCAETDPVILLRERLMARGLGLPEGGPAGMAAGGGVAPGLDAPEVESSGVVGLLTSAELADYIETHAEVEGIEARCIATVGLGNLLRAGDPPGPGPGAGTINLVVWLSVPLSYPAQLEALSIAAEARTLAVREAGLVSTRSGAPASGTGTDCIVIASPPTGDHLVYAGKHTTPGHLIGRTVTEAIRSGIQQTPNN